MKNETLKNKIERLEDIANGSGDLKKTHLRAVDYSRVSTLSEDQKKSLENQKETYANFIKDETEWEYVGSYCDEGITGTKIYYRGGFQAMIKDAKAGKFDLIVVKSVSRFARNLKECLNVLDQLKSYGVMVFFVENNLNSFRDQDQLTLKFMALGADMEARSARERTRIVFEQGIEHGRVYGNSKILGYTKKDCTLVVDPREAEIVKLIFELYVHERMGLRRIAKVLAERGMLRNDGTQISTRSIKTVLENPKYKGFYCGRKTKKSDLGDRYSRRALPQEDWLVKRDDKIPRIVSEELWDAAARIRAEKAEQYHREVSAPRNQGLYKYSGLIESGLVSGLHYVHNFYRNKGVTRDSWQCRNHKDMAHQGNLGPTLYTDELDAILFSILGELLDGYEGLIDDLVARYQAAAEKAPEETPIDHLKQELQTIREKQDRLLDLYEDGMMDKATLAQRNRDHEARKKAIEDEIQGIRERDKTVQQMTASLDSLRKSVAEAVNASSLDIATIRSLIEKIVVHGESTRKNIYLDVILRASELAPSFHIIRSRSNKNGTDNGFVFCSLCNQHTSM